MSMKSTLLLSTLFIIVSSQSHLAWADFMPPTIDQDESMMSDESRSQMKALFMDQNATPSMIENTQPSQNKLTAELQTMTKEEQVREFLDQPSVPEPSAPSDDMLKEEALKLNMINRRQSPSSNEASESSIQNHDPVAAEVRDQLKKETIREELQNEFLRLDLSPFSYQVVEN